MPKRKFKEEEKKTDPFQAATKMSVDWIKAHQSACIAGLVVLVVVVALVWSYGAFRGARNDRAQYALVQGINSFSEYQANPKGDGLSKAEASFKKVTEESSGGLKDVAKLYLARIDLLKGMKEPAKQLYSEIDKKPSNDVTKSLAEMGLRESGGKQ